MGKPAAEDGEFDYVIVGAGSAGCVLANRLTDDPKVRVALIEAGPTDRNIWIHIPVGYYRNIFNPKVAWNYQTEPDPQSRRPQHPLAARERARRHERHQRPRLHARSGGGLRPLAPARQPWLGLGRRSALLPAGRGQTRITNDFHGAMARSGVSTRSRARAAGSLHQGRREVGIRATTTSTARAGRRRLLPAHRPATAGAAARRAPTCSQPHRRNLRVVTDALVEAVAFEGRRATGVRFRQGGDEADRAARREVILAAGAIGSPQILQLSGVGPAALLQDKGVAVVHALAGVGQNLQDHLQARLMYKCTKPITLNDIMKSPIKKALVALEYALFRTGPLTIGAGHVCIFAKTGPWASTPDIQFHVMTFSADRAGTVLHPFPGFMSTVCQLRPESRGHLAIKSANPEEHPAIHPNYLAAELDRRTMVEGMKLARRVGRTAALKPYIAEELLPKPEFVTDEQLLQDIRERGTTIFHPVGTCKMAPESDAMGVVDDRLRVRGLEGLRVVDCSIMPTVVSGNTNAPAIMIGEKASDIIKADAMASAA